MQQPHREPLQSGEAGGRFREAAAQGGGGWRAGGAEPTGVQGEIVARAQHGLVQQRPYGRESKGVGYTGARGQVHAPHEPPAVTPVRREDGRRELEGGENRGESEQEGVRRVEELDELEGGVEHRGFRGREPARVRRERVEGHGGLRGRIFAEEARCRQAEEFKDGREREEFRCEGREGRRQHGDGNIRDTFAEDVHLGEHGIGEGKGDAVSKDREQGQQVHRVDHVHVHHVLGGLRRGAGGGEGVQGQIAFRENSFHQVGLQPAELRRPRVRPRGSDGRRVLVELQRRVPALELCPTFAAILESS